MIKREKSKKLLVFLPVIVIMMFGIATKVEAVTITGPLSTASAWQNGSVKHTIQNVGYITINTKLGTPTSGTLVNTKNTPTPNITVTATPSNSNIVFKGIAGNGVIGNGTLFTTTATSAPRSRTIKYYSGTSSMETYGYIVAHIQVKMPAGLKGTGSALDDTTCSIGAMAVPTYSAFWPTDTTHNGLGAPAASATWRDVYLAINLYWVGNYSITISDDTQTCSGRMQKGKMYRVTGAASTTKTAYNKTVIKYDGNNSTGGTTADQTVTYNTASTIRANGYTRKGYTFKNWNTTAGGTGTVYTAGQNVTTAFPTTTSLVLYAQWRPNVYTIRYDNNGGTGEMNTQTFNYDETKKLSIATFEKAGSKFLGWNTKQDGSGNWYTDEQNVSNITSTDGEEVRLYAQWAPESNVVMEDEEGNPISKNSAGIYYISNEKYEYKVEYVTDKYGVIDKDKEMVKHSENPLGIIDLPNTGYKLLMIKCDKQVTLNNGKIINGSKPMTLFELKNIKVTENLICNVYHKMSTEKTMQCE